MFRLLLILFLCEGTDERWACLGCMLAPHVAESPHHGPSQRPEGQCYAMCRLPCCISKVNKEDFQAFGSYLVSRSMYSSLRSTLSFPISHF